MSFLAVTLLFFVYAPVQVSAEFVVNNLSLAIDYQPIHDDIPAVDGNIIAFTVIERNQEDLNGDANDSVVHIYDHSTGTTTNLELSGENEESSEYTDWPLLVISDTFIVFEVSEQNQENIDLNGDGDIEDIFYT